MVLEYTEERRREIQLKAIHSKLKILQEEKYYFCIKNQEADVSFVADMVIRSGILQLRILNNVNK